ncbi:MAG TPA: hypothetical protein VGM33_19335 [Baekduia sp.]
MIGRGLAGAAAVALLAAAPAHAAGAYGKLAFGTSTGITVVAGDLAAPPTLALPDAQQPAWSPDGVRLAFARRNPADGLGIAGADGSAPVRLTSTPAATSAAEAAAPGFFGDLTPRWSPDASHLAFVRATLRTSEIWTVAADGTDAHRLLAATGADRIDADPHYLADGSRIRFTRDDSDLWDVRPDGAHLRRVVAAGGLDVVSAPDGSAYAVAGGGPVYAMDYTGGGLRRVAGAGREPLAFSADGAHLLTGVLNSVTAPGAVIDLAGHGRTHPVAPTEQGLTGSGFGAPSWWTPAPRQPFRAADDREAPESVVSGAGGRLVALRRENPHTITGALETTLLTVDQTGIRSISVAWVRGKERPRWHDVTKPGAFGNTVPLLRPATYRLLVRSTDVLGHTTKRPAEVIVKLRP